MNNKKILVSFLLVVLIALSVASVSAEDATDAVAVSQDTDDTIEVTDDADVISAQNYQPAANTSEAVQNAINSATNSGDTVDLSNYAEYDFGNSSVTIANSNIVLKGDGNTIIKGHGANAQGKGNALIMISASNVTIQGIKFIDTHPKNNFTYGGTVYGAAVQFQSANGGLLSDCAFNNFNSAAIVQRSTGVVLENNIITGGYTTLIANDPTVNTETGSKSFNIYGQSSGITVRGNTFEGQLLDGVSIAQGSGANIVENNVFIGNTYSIYFGGDATKKSVIRNNTFRNCGYFKEGEVEWKELPIISIQKASNDISIVDNKFEVINDTIAIAAEQGNEAHGFPSSLGNINVTGNNVTKYVEDVNESSVVLFHILVRNDNKLHIFAPVKIEGNTLLSGMDGYQVEIKDLGAIVLRGDEVTFENINTYFPTANTAAAVQAAVDAAVNPGDVVDLANFETYDFGNETIFIRNSNIIIKGKAFVDSKTGIFKHYTVVKGYGANDVGKGNAIFEISGSNVTVREFDFYDTHPKNNYTYNGTVYGAATRFASVTGGLLTSCRFYDFNSAAIVQRSTEVVLENNNIIGGYTTLIANDPTVNVETGSKSFNIYGQSNHITVRGNTFQGKILDGVSIAQGSGSNIVENNVFIGNTYSMYFGGDATKNSIIRNNTFRDCGYFKEGNVEWKLLPIISIQKASNDISIVDNKFEVLNNTIAIAAEQGNEAHGFPSSLGNINVTGNVIKKDADVSNVTLFHVLIRDGDKLNTFAPLVVKDNTLDGATGFIVETMSGNVLINANEAVIQPTISADTTIETADVNYTVGESGTLTIALKDAKGNGLANKTLSVFINGETKNLITNANGSATLNVTFDSANTYYATIFFMGDDDFKASIGSAKITVNAKPAPAPTPTPAPAAKKATTLTAKKATLKVKKAKKIKVTLKSSGKAVAGKVITIKVNKKTFKAKTNKKGVATIKVKITKKGKFTATVKFAGDSAYKAVTKKVKYTVKK